MTQDTRLGCRFMFKTFFAIAAAGLVLAGCANPIAYEATNDLWRKLDYATSPLEIARIEAELGSRRQETDTRSYLSKVSYLGRTTSTAYGKALYDRTTASPFSKDKNCGDFPSAAAAQKYFLASGGPSRDPHGLDRDGDGFACEWGKELQRIVKKHRANYQPKATRTTATTRRYTSSSRCHVGPRGGTYTITSSGRKNYGGC